MPLLCGHDRGGLVSATYPIVKRADGGPRGVERQFWAAAVSTSPRHRAKDYTNALHLGLYYTPNRDLPATSLIIWFVPV